MVHLTTTTEAHLLNLQMSAQAETGHQGTSPLCAIAPRHKIYVLISNLNIDKVPFL